MTVPVVTAMPPAPSRGDAPDLFEDRMDAFLAAVAGFVSDVNAVAVAMNSAMQLVPMAEESLALVSSYTVRHQGAHASAPTLRNDGNALQTGDLYFNTATGLTYSWSGSAWTPFAAAGRFLKTSLGESVSSDYTGSVSESVSITKSSAALRVLFPTGGRTGDLFRVVNETARRDHLINGNGAFIAGSSIDIEFNFVATGMTFEYNLVSNTWSPLNG